MTPPTWLCCSATNVDQGPDLTKIAGGCPPSVTLHKDVTASTEEGRRLFEAGLAQLLNFHHEAAIMAFTQALKLDEGLGPMANWGIALAIGPHYNFIPGLGSGYPAISAAMEKLDSVTELEKDLIRALATRSSKESHEKVNPDEFFFGTTEDENKAYADAMGKMAMKYPKNMDVKCFYVESLMNLNPWKLWTKEETGKITATDSNTLDIVEVLEAALATEVGSKHPGIIHMYIHAMELSPTPGKALGPANVLRTLMPDYGHLTHMPSHIDAWVGHYEDAILANIQGCKADDAWVAASGIDSEFYKFYRLHNKHFISWMAMMDGQSQLALKYADDLIKCLPEGENGVDFMLNGVIPMGQMFFEGFRATKLHVYIRFGMWEQLLAEPMPSPPEKFAATIAMTHYARGIAYASTNRVKEAEQEQELFLQARLSPDLTAEGRVNYNSPYYADDGTPCILGVAEKMLDGEIAYRKKDYDTAFTHLREAVKRDEALAYDEPWPWQVPTRHALGALLLEQGNVIEAADVYRRDLLQYPKNLWALLGLKKCLAAGAPSKPDDGDVPTLFATASKRADVKLEYTCFCAGVPEAKASSPCLSCSK